MHPLGDISWWRLSACGLCLIFAVAVSLRMKLGIERTLTIASIRGPLQLFAVGYALSAIFAVRNPLLVIALLLIMLSVAARTGAGRLSRPLPHIAPLLGVSLACGTAISLVVMTTLVVPTEPWYDPQYLIPFGGMLLGNSMNAASLAGERFQEELRARRLHIETLLCVGFSGPDSVHEMFARSLRASMIPTLHAFMVAGIVQLPGMMTGQILAGVDPLMAVKYQVLIFFLLLTSVMTTSWMFLSFLRSHYFTPTHQFRSDLL